MKDKEEKIREQLVIALNLIEQEEKKVEILLVENVKKKDELHQIQLKLAELNGENNVLKEHFGWKDITDEEMKYVITSNPTGFNSFIPSLETIRCNMKKEQGKSFFDIKVDSLWDYDRSLCHSRKTIGLRVKEVTDKSVKFYDDMAYEGYGIEYFDGKTFKPHVKK